MKNYLIVIIILLGNNILQGQTVYFSYSNGNLVEEQLSDSKESVSIDLVPDCNNNEVAISLSGVDSVYFNNSKGSSNQSFSPEEGESLRVTTFKNGCIEDQYVWLDPVVPSNTNITGTTDIYTLDSAYTYLAIGDSKSTFSWVFENDSILSVEDNKADVVWKYKFGESQIKLTETSMYGCEGEEAILTVFDYLTISDFTTLSIGMFPNPARDRLNFELELDDSYHYRIFDFSGKEVKSDLLQGTSIEVSELRAGTYYLTISNGTDTFSSKFNKF